jgi:NAD(P)H dehydrogenase (quinone)
MTILVTAAGGQLGRLVVDALLERGTDPQDILAGARTPAKVADLAERGIRTIELDYSQPATIAAALEGVDTVLLISGSEPGVRFAGHKNVIDDAVAAGVAKLVYTSAPKATSVDWVLGADHRATEEAIAASGLPHVIVRNNWYTENYVMDVLRAAETGVIAASVGDARVASASRADFAEGAAAVLLDDSHLGRTYEFAGDATWSYDDLAAAASSVLGRDVAFVRWTPDEQRDALLAAGLDESTVGFVVALDAAIAGGVLADTDGTLSRIIGRATTPLTDGLRDAVEAARASA